MTSAGSAFSSSSKPPTSQQLHQITTVANSSASYSSSASSSSSSSSSRSPRTASAVAAQNQACAACKYQRRKCNPDCPLATYFPADQQRRFLNAHRLFGVSNIQRTLRDTEPELRQDAMRALIFQAEARAYDPVGGCYRITFNLLNQLKAEVAELDDVLAHLNLCRQQAAASNSLDVDAGMLLTDGAVDGVDVVNQYVLMGHNQMQPAQNQMQPAQNQLYDYFYYDGTAGEEDPSRQAWGNAGNVQLQYGNGAADVKTGSPVALGEQLEQHCQIGTQFVDFDMKPPQMKTTLEHAAGNGSFEHREETVTQDVVESERDNQVVAQMAQSAAARSHCQLELGFSS